MLEELGSYFLSLPRVGSVGPPFRESLIDIILWTFGVSAKVPQHQEKQNIPLYLHLKDAPNPCLFSSHSRQKWRQGDQQKEPPDVYKKNNYLDPQIRGKQNIKFS